ncbi:amphoterin-induced protein 1 [Petromyzon marinus]|uniref:Amphoterin-induced protein 1-like n=1 Tax=Petromyzon marinus TaxID=7757 RepID=A0AAJ7TJG2_PETMA|nr:amphoterin-induced protein 1-like [Petromyzon marinus]
MLLLLLLPSLATAVALLACRSSHAAAPRSCPAPCTCAGEVVDCSGRAIASLRPGSVSLPRYASVLDLSHNLLQKLQPGWLSGSAALSRLSVAHCRLNFIAQGAFSPMGHLQHLDLSSNRLGSLEADTLEGLPALEVLLLYNNSISRLNAAAFTHSPLLRAVYLSHNALLRVPADTLVSMGRLSLFDVSFNRVASVPVQELNALPAPLRDGLLLHGNPLECECQLYLLLASWRRRRFRSVTEFADGEMRCARRAAANATALATTAIDLLQARPEELGCSQTGGDVFRASYRAHLTDVLTIPCDVLVVGQSGTEYEWLTPSRTLDSVRILPGGALEIRALEPEKLSGEYTCRAWNARLRINDSVTVNVTVMDTPPPESFSTGLTTLIACSATLLMVLVYLYLTPCGCRRHAQHRRREHPQSRPRCCNSCSYCCYSCLCLRCCGHDYDDAAATAGCCGPCSHGGGGGGDGGGDCCQFGHSMHADVSGGGGAVAGGGRMSSHATNSRAPGHSVLLGPGSSCPGTGAKHVAFREPAAASHNGSAGARLLVRIKSDSESASSVYSDATTVREC